MLRKDFVIDPYQLLETRLLGADAVLLIVRILGHQQLGDLLFLAAELGLAALVEVHTAEEVERAVAAGAEIIGVNNRDLDTFAVDPATALRLAPAIPVGVVSVAESGITEPEQVARLAEAGFDAILVGEALMRAADPGAELTRLLGHTVRRVAR